MYTTGKVGGGGVGEGEGGGIGIVLTKEVSLIKGLEFTHFCC